MEKYAFEPLIPSKIKLSEAINLGRGLIKWNELVTLCDGEGCAMGMGLAAMGLTWGSEYHLNQLWPWTRQYRSDEDKLGFWWRISTLFSNVCDGEITLDDLITWVRSVEPETEVVCSHCDGTGVEPVETSAYPPEPCSECKVEHAVPVLVGKGE